MPGHCGASSSPAAPAASCRLAATKSSELPAPGKGSAHHLLPPQPAGLLPQVPLAGTSTGVFAVPKRVGLSLWCKHEQPCPVWGSWGCLFPLAAGPHSRHRFAFLLAPLQGLSFCSFVCVAFCHDTGICGWGSGKCPGSPVGRFRRSSRRLVEPHNPGMGRTTPSRAGSSWEEQQPGQSSASHCRAVTGTFTALSISTERGLWLDCF